MLNRKASTCRSRNYISINTSNAHLNWHLGLRLSVNELRAAGLTAKATLEGAAGTMEAWRAHIATLIARIRLLNGEPKQAHERLDALTSRLALNLMTLVEPASKTPQNVS